MVGERDTYIKADHRCSEMVSFPTMLMTLQNSKKKNTNKISGTMVVYAAGLIVEMARSNPASQVQHSTHQVVESGSREPLPY